MTGVIQTSYLTIEAAAGPVEIRVLGSRFIAGLHPVGSFEAVVSVVDGLRKSHHAATHVCTAYRLFGAGDEGRADDDGEPSGTAGVPLLGEIRRLDLENVLVTVVRYFGGTKLGTGRLRRAYASAARAVLDTVKPVRHRVLQRVQTAIPFSFIGEMMRIVAEFSAVVVEQSFDEKGVRMVLSVPLEHMASMGRVLRERSAGNVVLREVRNPINPRD